MSDVFTVVVISGGASDPSTTRMLADRVTAAVARVIADHYVASEAGQTRGVGVKAGHAQFGDHGCC